MSTIKEKVPQDFDKHLNQVLLQVEIDQLARRTQELQESNAEIINGNIQIQDNTSKLIEAVKVDKAVKVDDESTSSAT